MYRLFLSVGKKSVRFGEYIGLDQSSEPFNFTFCCFVATPERFKLDRCRQSRPGFARFDYLNVKGGQGWAQCPSEFYEFGPGTNR